MSSIQDLEEEPEILVEEPEEINYIADADTTCTICYAEFLDPDDLNIHLDKVHKISSSMLKKCQFCSEIYRDIMTYAEHIRDNHISSLKSCTYCWRVFEDCDEHKSHCRKHVLGRSESTYGCSQCNQRFTDLGMLKKHEFEHKNNKEGVMLHEVIPYLSAALKVKSVTFLDALGTDVVYICVGCDFSTVDMGMYLKHVSSDECAVYVCHTCGNVFKKKCSLVKHAQTNCNIFGITIKKVQLCLDCNTYISCRLYSKHKSVCKPIKCYSCNIIFASMNDWAEHQSQEHAGVSVEVETCQYCWKRCVGSVAMKKHIDKTHRPEFHLYKYLCIYCKNVFKHPQKLFGHFLTKHKHIYPYTCRICNKIFRFRKKFTIHIKMVHKSVGFVEFNEDYHVIFSDKKSDDPFVPKSLYVDETQEGDNKKTLDNSGEVELNSDFMNATETEGNQTEAEVKKKPKRKRKRNTKTRKGNQETILIESSDDDEPLLVVRKRVRQQMKKGNVGAKRKRLHPPDKTNRALLTCSICDKYCYTFQNYNHHVSLHSKHEVKKCIKCSKIFKSKLKLNEHIAKDHSSSKLTDTLKTLLEKRKSGAIATKSLPTSVKFGRTVKKVAIETSPTSAKITAVDHKLSVQKFFENFVPEDKIELPVNSTASIKIVTRDPKEPTIKMTKFNPNPSISTSFKLAMPVKFVDHYPEKVKMTLKFVEAPSRTEDKYGYYSDQYEPVPEGDRHESIPEVAEEIMLEGTEEAPKSALKDFAHKITLPKLPTEVTDIRIAHLLPQAPFYKIVKVKDVLVQDNEEKVKEEPPSSIKLADGTRLVTTNPLAHLLGKEHEKVLESVKNKYYKPKNKNVQGLLAKALTILEKPTPTRRKKKENSRVIELPED